MGALKSYRQLAAVCPQGSMYQTSRSPHFPQPQDVATPLGSSLPVEKSMLPPPRACHGLPQRFPLAGDQRAGVGQPPYTPDCHQRLRSALTLPVASRYSLLEYRLKNDHPDLYSRQTTDLETKKIVKLIKDSGLKVQAQIMDEIVRVTGKKIDDLQEVIAACRAANLSMPLQFTNMKQ